MLVLSRKIGEKIVIDEHITITVLSIKGNTVKLGIEAPSEIGIRRSELVVEIDPTNPEGENGASEAA